jgi:hypothetical protein
VDSVPRQSRTVCLRLEADQQLAAAEAIALMFAESMIKRAAA